LKAISDTKGAVLAPFTYLNSALLLILWHNFAFTAFKTWESI
jgi:hypothetical protein